MNTWQIEERVFEPHKLHVTETIYTIGNGYFGTRGSFEEGYPDSTEATLLWGVFDGIALGKEELANVPDWLPIKLVINGEHFHLDRGKLLHFQRTLDLQRGLLQRHVLWESPLGIRLSINSERFASLADEHVGAQHFQVTVEQLPEGVEEVEVDLWAAFNPAVGNENVMHWDTVAQGHEGEALWLHSQTRQSQIQLVQAMTFMIDAPGFQKELLDFAAGIRLYGKMRSGETVTAEKVVTMYTSRDEGEPKEQALSLLSRCGDYNLLQTQHKKAWQHFWERADILIEGDEKAQQAVRYNLYQLRINTSFSDNRASIGAKGLTGFGYHGHVLYDTEIFMLPFFTYVYPEIARRLLLYRYQLLPAAEQKAKQNGYQGAQYPWESTLDGKEATPTYMPRQNDGQMAPVLNGQLELHGTADIAFATWQYWQVSGDNAFMRDYGAEILLKTALFWSTRAEYNHKQQRYEINNVIGPDEWHQGINNNAYTNFMACWNIQTALAVLDWLTSTAPTKREELVVQLALSEERLHHWHDIIAHLHIPQDPHTGIFEQFDGFFQLKTFDKEAYAERNSSYQAIVGLEALQGYQILKQADVLLLLTLLTDRFDRETKQANWEYYFPITDHDYGSSLSPAMHAILACELDQGEVGYNLLLKGVLDDLENLRGDSAKGVHLGSCGAEWQAIVFGFAGLRLTPYGYTTTPCLPQHWRRLAFTIHHKGQPIHIDLQR